MSRADEIARAAYKDFLDKASAEKRTFSKDELRKHVVEELLLAVESGEVKPNSEEWAKGVFESVDNRQYTKDQRALRNVSNQLRSKGQEPIDIALLSDLKNCQVSCGEEGRVTFGSLDLNLALLCDREHYENLKDAQDAYNDWRSGIFDRFMPYWRKGMTASQVIDSGLLFNDDEE